MQRHVFIIIYLLKNDIQTQKVQWGHYKARQQG